MSNPEKPVANFPFDFKVSYYKEIVGEFLKTVDATRSSFNEEHDYPDLHMYRN